MKVLTIIFLILVFISQINAYNGEEITWTDSTTKKLVQLEKLWFAHDLAIYMISHCKLEAKDPEHCIRLMASIGYNESSAGKKAKNNNIFWKRWAKFETKEDAVKWWVSVYVKKWYKPHKYTPSSFYSKTPKPPITYFCMDERQKNGKMLNYCPNWYAHSWSAWNKLTFK